MDDVKYKSAARLQRGDRVLFKSKRDLRNPGDIRVVYTVDHTQRLSYGVVRVFHSRYGLQHIDAAASHRFELAREK